MSIPEIIKMYESGSRTVEIAEQANVSARYINSVLQSNDVTRRPRGSWLRQYTINENYFKTWSNNMAYLLGFFVADGNMPHDHQLISFSQKDPFILEVEDLYFYSVSGYIKIKRFTSKKNLKNLKKKQNHYVKCKIEKSNQLKQLYKNVKIISSNN